MSSEAELDGQSDDGGLDVPCVYCNELYSRSASKERWIRCEVCLNWADNLCAGIKPTTKRFICDVCH